MGKKSILWLSKAELSYSDIGEDGIARNEEINKDAVPGRNKNMPLLELYERFVSTGYKYNGAMALAYGAEGVKTKGSVEINIGSLIVPVLDLKLNFGAEGEKATELWYLLQRSQASREPYMPEPAGGQSTSGTAAGEGKASRSIERNWYSAQPVSICVFEGAMKRGSVEATVTAGVSLPKLLPKDELGMSLSAQTSLGAAGEVTSLKLQVGDVGFPMFYGTESNDQVKQDFLRCFRDDAMDSLKIEIVQWAVGEMLQSLANKERKEFLSSCKEKIINRIRAELPPLAKSVCEKLEQLGTDSGLSEQLTTVLKGWAEEQVAEGTATVAGLERLMDGVKGELQKNFPDGAKAGFEHGEIEMYSKLTEFKERAKELMKVANLERNPFGKVMKELPSLCHIDLLSIGGEVSAGVSGELSANAGASGKFSGVTLEAIATASTKLTGKAALTSYRYQTSHLGIAQGLNPGARRGSMSQIESSPMVMTQDTVISHRQVQGAAEVLFSATLGKGGEGDQHRTGERSGEKDFYNTMTYTSAVAFWLYRGNAGPISLYAGSGICFGCSVFLSRLANLTAEKEQPLVNTLAEALRVSTGDLILFLKQAQNAGLNNITPEMVGGGQALLLESSFAFSGDCIQIEIGESDRVLKNTRGGLLNVQSIKTMADKLRAQGVAPTVSNRILPTCIRLRVRTTDTVNNSRSKFKLGFKVANIDITSEERAGLDGAYDLFTLWFDPKRICVPPVALINQ